MKLKILSTARTNNFTDAGIASKIKGLWSQNSAMVESTFQSNQAIYIVYHGYDSDYRGDYSVSLCISSPAADNDFDTSMCSWSEYPVNASSETGIFDTWQTIWHDEDQNTINRLYAFDYEEYSPNGSVSIAISKDDK